MKMTRKTMLLRFLAGSRLFFAGSILAAAIVAGLDMVTPQIIRVVVDYGMENRPENLPQILVSWLEQMGGRDFVRGHLYLAAAAVLVTALLSAVFQYLNIWLNSAGTERMSRTARDLLYDHIAHLPYDWHMKNQTGDIIQRCTSDVNSVRNFVSEQLVQVIRIVILILFSAACMVSMNRKLSIVVLLSVPIIVGYSWFFFERIGHLFLECDENEGVLSTITQENLTGVRVVRAFGREEYERERFRRQNEKYTDAWMDLCRLLAGFWASGDAITGIQLMLIIILGCVFCVRGSLTAGELIAFIAYNRRLIWPVRHLGRMISEMSKAGVAMDRLLYILNSETEESDNAGTDTPPMTGDIVFEHVSFGYDSEKLILQDIDLMIRGGETLGVLGGTGSGKTTLINLINRLYEPTEGEIRVDRISLRDIPLAWLRAHVGIVLQEPYLFSRTIGENITIAGCGDEAGVRRVIRTAALEETIEHFSKGLDTMVGERGVTLSGGQKQRAAIARMLMQDTPIMIFDDSLSAVDAQTDERIRRELAQYHGDKTMILISHRISTLRDADRIIVLADGRIVQQGTHEELLKQGGCYLDTWRIQHPEEVTEHG